MEEKEPQAPPVTQEDAELLKQYQAAIEMEEGEEDAEYDEEMTEEETKIYEDITLENRMKYVAEATKMKIARNYDRACLILKLLIQKLTALYKGDSLHNDLAMGYYLMGDTILEKVENSSDVFGGTANQSVKEEMGENDGSDKNKEKKPSAMPQVDDDDVQASWENLDVARLIIQRRLDNGDLGEETKVKLLKQLALIHSRLGTCLSWRDQFKGAVEEYSQCLALQEQAMDAERSRQVAETLYIIGNTMCYMTDEEKTSFDSSPIQFFQRAAGIFENLINEEYEKRGIQIQDVKADSKGIKKAFAMSNSNDDNKTLELKSVLKSIYQKIIDSFTENEVKKLLQQEKQQKEVPKPAGFGVNAFGQPISGEAQPVKHLGSFGSAGNNGKKDDDSKLGKRDKPESDDDEDKVEKKLKTD